MSLGRLRRYLRVTATATEPLALFPVTANYWWETSAGKTLRIEALHPLGEEGTLGSAEGTPSTERGSQLAEMLGGNESVDFDGSSFHFAVGEFTKKVFPRRRKLKWPAAIVTAALAVVGASVFPGAAVTARAQSSGCTAEARAQQLRDAQLEVLGLLRPSPGVDLTVLRNEADLAALAALGYGIYGHQQVSFRGMGWEVLDGLAPQDPAGAKPIAGRPTLLLYAPTLPAPPGTVTEPRDGFDFPYRLAGWAYIFPFDFEQHPVVGGDGGPFFRCLGRKEWFVHERGVHPFGSGAMDPRPPAEENHGTAPGNDPPTEDELAEGVLHPRLWDLHLWLDGDEVPTVSMLNPGDPIPGIDPLVGVSPPPAWPDPPYPAFYYPQRAGAEPVRFEGRNCDGVQVEIRVPLANVDPLVPAEFTVETVGANDARLVILAGRCQQVGGGGAAITAALRVAVNDPDPANPPEGEDTPPQYVEAFHFYQFWIASSNRDLVRFFRSYGGLTDRQAVWVPDLAFHLDPITGDFRFEAPKPTPSPFTIAGKPAGGGYARVGPAVIPLSVTGDEWTAVPIGTMKVAERVDGMFGETDGYVVPEPGSDIDVIFCGSTNGRFSTVSGDPFVTSLRFSLDNSYLVRVLEEETSGVGRPSCVR
jgi:hypothetical protein